MAKNLKIIIPIFLIVVFGFFLRIYNIENVPPGIYPDEAVNGEDAIRALNTGNFQWFYPVNTGREGLFMNLIAFCFYFFGTSILTLKLPAIIFSTLSIWGTYLLAKEMFDRRIGIISSFLVAFSFWSINFGRISFRANMLPAILVFSFYFIFKGLRTKKWWDFIIGGIIFGFGMHSYIAWRISPAIPIIFIIFLVFFRKKFIKEYWKFMLIFLCSAFIIAIPMFYTFYNHPEYFESRSDSVSIFSPARNKGNLIGTFLRSLSLSLIKYNFVGDMNWRHNFPPYPLLDPLSGIAFLFGIILSFIKFFNRLHELTFKKIRHKDLEKYAFLIIWFFVMLIPEFLTAEGNPHALRSIGTLPVVFIFSALTFDFLLKKLRNYGYFSRKLTFGLIVIFLTFIGIFNTVKYHVVWAQKERVAFSFDKNVTEISRFIKTLPQEQEKFIITTYNTLIKLPIYIFHSQDPTIKYFYPNELDKIDSKKSDNSIFIFIEKNVDSINQIKNRFPVLKLEEIRNDPAGTFYILKK